MKFNMKLDKYYILIQNRRFRHENSNDDFHIEKLFSIEDINQIKSEVVNLNDFTNTLVVTDDEEYLKKYIFTINLDELKMLCGFSFNKSNIRINAEYFGSYDKLFFKHFAKVFNKEVISTSMSWKKKLFNDESSDYYFDFMGWKENFEFLFYKKPYRYRSSDLDIDVFNIEHYDEVTLVMLNKIFNTNVLEIECNKYPQNTWEKDNSFLKYYDKLSCKKLYILPHLLEELRNPGVRLKTETSFSKSQYVEYYAVDLIQNKLDPKNIPNKYISELDDSKYNGVHGFDDDTIDSAFEGNPDNYWNID